MFTADHYRKTWRLEISPDQIEEVFLGTSVGRLWRPHATLVNDGDLVRCRLTDRSGEFWLTLAKPRRDQVTVSRWPKIPATVLAAAAKVAAEDQAFAKVVSSAKH
jgi:hypothetical protein